MQAKPRSTPSFKLFSATALMCLAAVSAPAQAQSRTCIIDEVNGQHRCGYLADEQGYEIPRAEVQMARVLDGPRGSG